MCFMAMQHGLHVQSRDCVLNHMQKRGIRLKMNQMSSLKTSRRRRPRSRRGEVPASIRKLRDRLQSRRKQLMIRTR